MKIKIEDDLFDIVKRIKEIDDVMPIQISYNEANKGEQILVLNEIKDENGKQKQQTIGDKTYVIYEGEIICANVGEELEIADLKVDLNTRKPTISYAV